MRVEVRISLGTGVRNCIEKHQCLRWLRFIIDRRAQAGEYAASKNKDNEGGFTMQIDFYLAPVLSLIAGILILLMPRLLNYIVAIYLIVIGVMGLLGYSRF